MGTHRQPLLKTTVGTLPFLFKIDFPYDTFMYQNVQSESVPFMSATLVGPQTASIVRGSGQTPTTPTTPLHPPFPILLPTFSRLTQVPQTCIRRPTGTHSGGPMWRHTTTGRTHRDRDESRVPFSVPNVIDRQRSWTTRVGFRCFLRFRSLYLTTYTSIWEIILRNHKFYV